MTAPSALQASVMRRNAGNHRVIRDTEVSAGQERSLVHRLGLDDDHRRSAAGAFQIVVQMLIARQAALGHVAGVGAENHAIAQGMVPERQWLHQSAVLRV